MLSRFMKGDVTKTSLKVLSNAKPLDVLRQQASLTSQSDRPSQ